MATYNEYWPFSKHGMFPDIARGDQFFRNRQSLNVFQAFKTVIGTEDLLVSLDRFGIIKPKTEDLTSFWETMLSNTVGTLSTDILLNAIPKMPSNLALTKVSPGCSSWAQQWNQVSKYG